VPARRLNRWLLLFAILGVGSLAAASTAGAHYPSVTEFQTGLTPNNGAWDIVAGPEGRLWFTEDSISAFGALSAGDGLIGEFNGLLTVAGNPKGITTGPDGNLWIAESGLGGAIARVTPAGAVTEFNTGLTPSDPWDITAGPDGNLWFVSRSPAFIGRITTDGTVTEFSTGLTPESQPTAITAGPDGNLWFTESADPGRIGRITTDGVVTENSIGLTPNMAPTDITTGPDGNLWFTERAGAGAIGRITPEGQITEYRNGLTSGSQPTGIAAGTDGALWFTEAASPGRIGRISRSGEVTEYGDGLTPDRSPWFITPGPDGNIWFTENANPGALARISLPPTVRSRSVQYLSDNSAQLPAKIRPNAQATDFYFEWGPTEPLTRKTGTSSAGSGWDHVEVMTRVAKLAPSTKYYYRVVATNESGSTTGARGEFTTAELEAEPEFARRVVAEPKGRVRFKRPGGRWRPLPDGGAELPVGVALDTRRGSVRLTSVGQRRGRTQTGIFGGGVLQVRQPRTAGGRLDLYLRGGDFARCRRGAPARSSRVGGRAASRAAQLAAASRAAYLASASREASASKLSRVRRLWGRDSGGRFRTHGRHSHATVRGTRWLTEDRCAGTFTRVTNGAVVVRDLTRRRSVVVRAGHHYLAPRGHHLARRRH
jgi:streptogramin lyase